MYVPTTIVRGLLPHPTIISESGRAITAHHAVLISNVIGTEQVVGHELAAPSEDEPLLLQNMWKSWMELEQEDPGLLEILHDSVADLADVHTQYTMGFLSLTQRAWAEDLHINLCLKVKEMLNPVNRRISIVVLNKETEAAIMRQSGPGETIYAPPGIAAKLTPAPDAQTPAQ